MKRFLVFGGAQYYADGGMADFINSLNDSEEAIILANSVLGLRVERLSDKVADEKRPYSDGPRTTKIDWVEVWDAQEMVMVYEAGHRYGGW